MKKLLLPAVLLLTCFAPAVAQTTQVRPVPAFHAIEVGSGIKLTLNAGHSQRVEVGSNVAEFAPYVHTSVEGGVLHISYDNPNDRNGQQRSRQQVQLLATVTADELTALTAGSGSLVTAQGDFDAAEFKLEVSSGALVKAGIATTTLAVRQSSGSLVTLTGHATSLDLQTGSGATFKGSNLQTDHCRAQASSGSSVRVAVKDDLLADANSGASISYSGSPKLTKRVSSGASVSGR